MLLERILRILSVQSQSQSYVTADGQSATLSWNKAPVWGLRPDFYHLESCGVVDVGRSVWRDVGSVVYNSSLTAPAQLFSEPSPVGLVTIF
jgi:hypothetical protein